MRALLVVNHQATTTSRHSRDVLIRALRSATDLAVEYTRGRNHATALVRHAASGVDLVVAHGGDGTVNEVVNGLMLAGQDSAHRPALAVVPGGSTNVFARALGLPPDWAEATGMILEALRDGRSQTIGLGRADGRYFTFCAGLGVDAAAIQRVEHARRRGRTSTSGRYLRAAVGAVLLGRVRRPPVITATVSPPGTPEPEPAAERFVTVIVQNTAPWTYLGARPVDPNPDASFDLGLDVLALRALRVPSAARTFGQMLARGSAPHGRQVVRWHDVAGLRLDAEPPQPFQVDGDYLGERAQVQLTAVPQALRVVC